MAVKAAKGERKDKKLVKSVLGGKIQREPEKVKYFLHFWGGNCNNKNVNIFSTKSVTRWIARLRPVNEGRRGRGGRKRRKR